MWVLELVNDSRTVSLLLVFIMLGLVSAGSFVAGEYQAGGLFVGLASIPLIFLVFKSLGICCVTDKVGESNQPSSHVTDPNLVIQAEYSPEPDVSIPIRDNYSGGDVVAVAIQGDSSENVPVADVIHDTAEGASL